MKLFNRIVAWILYLLFWFIVGFIAATFLSGCSILQPAQPPITPENGITILYRTICQTNWLATVAIIGVATSAFAFLNGNKWGIAGMVSCFIALTMTLCVARYGAVLAFIGLIGSVGLMVYSMYIKNRALKEIIGNVESIKSRIDSPAYSLLSEEVSRDLTIQSPQTIKLVKQIKQKNGLEKGSINGTDKS